MLWDTGFPMKNLVDSDNQVQFDSKKLVSGKLLVAMVSLKLLSPALNQLSRLALFAILLLVPKANRLL
jgi:hypothetical protein